LKPDSVLDVGCGCGSFTSQLSPYCDKITAIDHSQVLIDRCRRENGKPNIEYMCMDGRSLRFPNNGFDLVLERTTLHHVLEWQKVLDEMVRVSSKHILVEEPLDDPRSEEKKNTMRAQSLYLEIQREVGYSHYNYIPLGSLTGYFRERGVPVGMEIIKSDEPVDFDELFRSFEDFAEKSNRKQYWLDRLESLRQELRGKMLCEEDIVFISAVKR
jgi:ubiquinone/menaquinone biosynthesis C-methylase UbiE